MQKKYLKPAVALLLVAAMGFGGTLAYITSDSEKIDNNFVFSVSDTENQEEDDSLLVVKLTEVFEDSEGNDCTGSATFIAGEEFAKTATVTLPTNALTEGAYVFVEVTDTDTNELLEYSVDAASWTNITGTNVWYYTGAQTGTTFSETVLTDNKVTVKSDATVAHMEAATAGNPVKISIKAYAIQAANFETPAEAWEAFRPTTPTV